jgi:hypothetical protein
MKLINTTTLQLEDFISGNQPPYAILSHTWENGEVSFQDFKNLDSCRHQAGFAKIEHTCQLAREAGIDYAWVDTCCINKKSSAELSEAINSMFQWYANSVVCYVYLSDLDLNDDAAPKHFDSKIDPTLGKLDKCRWFSRGWTLQELIAPRRVEFYDTDWTLYHGTGDSGSMWTEISRITKVDESVLNGTMQLHSVPVGRRMSWAAGRQTTRVEDLAYCLLGIFGVNMPMLYGEGEKSFIRLQEEIARGSTDMTLFSWRSPEVPDCVGKEHYDGIFARSPAYFIHAGQVLPNFDHRLNGEFTLTNKGLRIRTLVERDADNVEVLPLNCVTRQTGSRVGIYIKSYGPNMYARISSANLALNLESQDSNKERTIYISTKREEDVYSSPIPFRYNFPLTDIVPIAPKIQWNFRAKAWMPHGPFAFTGLVKLSSKVFSEAVYILLHRPEGQYKPSVKLANQFLFDGIEITPSTTELPSLSMNQMVHDVVVFDRAHKDKPAGLLSVSIVLSPDGKTYIVDLVLDKSCAESLPNRSVYANKFDMKGGYASEIYVPNRQPGELTRKFAFQWGPQ